MSTLVSFTLDNLGDAADLQRGVIQAPRAPGTNPPLEQGYPALLELFGRHEVPLTCFVEGWSARQYPDYLRQIRALGHEIGMHGWQHEAWAQLDDSAVATLATRATESIAEALGEAPRAFRAPGGISSPYTQQVLVELGFDVDASYRVDPQPTLSETGLACLPYQWAGVDATHWLWNRHSPDEAERQWHAALDKTSAAGLPFVFIWHPHVMGIHPEGLEVGARLLRYLRDNPAFDIVSLRELRQYLFAA